MTREQFILHVSATRESFRRFLVALCCGDTALADDVAQESYMKAYLSCDGISNPDKFRSWLYKIGYNTFLNHKRGVKRKVDYTEVEDMAAADASDGSVRYQELYTA
ncbi:MAG: RNA polymerase sigma factor [Muribaculaceae bacterium]|nr:RNA polymerase sigma factor [Muribaculaceae bacterium]